VRALASGRRVLPAALALLLLADAAPAPAGTPPASLDRKLVAMADRVADDPTSSTAVVDVIAMTRLWDLTTPGVFEAQAERLASLHGLHPEARLRLQDASREELLHAGRFEEAARAVRDGGLVTRWLVVGPFDNENRKGFEVEYGPEADPGEPFDVGLAFSGDERSVSWREIDAVPVSGMVDFRNHLYPTTKVCGYAGTYLDVPSRRTLGLWAASAGTLRMWVDETLVIEDDVYRSTGLDRHAVRVVLGKGTHRLLAKVCVDDGPWNLVARVTDAKGRPAGGLTTLEPRDAYAAGKPPAVKRMDHAFASLERRLAEAPDDPEVLAGMARYMILTGSDDRTETVAGDHAHKAAEATGSCEHLLLLAMATDDPGIGINALRDCTIAEPDNARAAFLHAVAMKGNIGEADFTNHVLDLVRRFPGDLRVRILWVQELVDAGMPLTAMTELEQLRLQFGEVPELLRASEYLASTAVSKEESLEWKHRLLEMRHDEQSVIVDLADSAAGAGDEETARRLVELRLSLRPDDRNVLRWAADVAMAMDDRPQARAHLERATQVSPHNPHEWEHLAYFYRLVGEKDLALAALTTVLELNPGNVAVREYMAHLFPKSRFEEEFIVPADEIREIAASLEAETDPPDARDVERYDATILVDQRVDRVYGNGMSARFFQNAVRINSEQGGKTFRYIPITYAPLREELDLIRARVYRHDGTIEDMVGRYSFPIFDPDVRIYYDVIREVVELPPLREGDVIDVQYKISDATARNMFEKHYGTAVGVRSAVPVVMFRYGLITPRDMQIAADVPPSLEASRVEREAGEHESEPTVLRTWETGDVEAIEEEPRMPPMQEISPLIKVSTFETWEEFGRWWWGLASSQMVADKTIRDRVEELVDEGMSDREKVEAIFDWVIRSTRYIALEFGVHGYKPYPSPQVVARGFGDCKDKSTLLYVMIEQAGVDAALALVRTRHAGEIGSGFPFQFQFDHVIAYVPSLDLFLDGTVDYLDASTLPPADQDVFALIVDESSVTARHTPRAPFDESRVDTDVVFTLDEQGGAALSGKLTIRGSSRAFYRSTYQTQGTRGERLEQQLSGVFPGLRLDTWSFSGLDDYSREVEISFTATIPNFALAHDGTMQFSVLPSHELFQGFASLSQRRHDVVIGHPRLFVDRHTYVAPDGWEFRDIPGDLDLNEEGDTYWFEMDSGGSGTSRAQFTATLGFGGYRVHADAYEPFRDFCSEVDDAMLKRAHLVEVKP
jgi:transglutaminase-like putative cysteine protease/Flp pilus assembly protein TadD